MKTTTILVLTAIAVFVIGVRRQDRLMALKEETRRLEQHRSNPARSSGKDHAVRATPDAPPGQVSSFCEMMVDVLVANRDRSRVRNPEWAERGKRLLLAAKDLPGQDMAKVLDALFVDDRVADMGRDQIIWACHELFAEVSPFAWRECLGSRRDLPDWQKLFEAATRKCMVADTARALALVDREAANGNPEVVTTDIRSSVLLALAVSDPDQMFARVLSPEFAADPDALAHLGGFVDDRLKKPADHQRFLAALRRAQESNPSPVLDKIREDYVREMAGKLHDWPAYDAHTLVDSEFTPTERFHVAQRCASHGELTDPGKWVDWFLKIDPDEWDAWIRQQNMRLRHPLLTQISGRALWDAELPAKWLEKIPDGPLRDSATLEYAWMIAARDPARAARYLDQLPATNGKQNLIRKIEDARSAGGFQVR